MAKNKIKIGLIQINNSFGNQNYLPYTVGLFQAYSEKYLKNKNKFEFLLPIYKRIPVKTAVKQLLKSDISFFSTYVWNYELSLEIAKQIKEKNPEIFIVFGGPMVPDNNVEDFLRSHPFIDMACHGEGEETFVSILENYKTDNWSKIQSISYIDKPGKLVQNHRSNRISDLNKIPSPYITGVFDPLIKAHPEDEWLALWETNRGCPYSCSYCVWGAYTDKKIYPFDLERLYKEVDWFSDNKIEFVYCCDANFGILNRTIEIVNYFANNKKKHGNPKVLSTQTVKIFTEKTYQTCKIMAETGLNKGIALALQSLHPDTLRDTKRKNISVEKFKEIQQRLTSENIETFTDIILALPSETYDSFADGTSTIIENGQHNRIQFNNLSILTNAEMDNREYQEKYGFEIVETNVLNMHGSLSHKEEVQETQRLVIGTNTMSGPDWVKTRVFGWMAALLHFDKLLQIPFVALNKLYSVKYRDLIEIFTEGEDLPPILTHIKSFFNEKAVELQNGGSEFCRSEKWLNLWWPCDELILIQLATENKLQDFYEEVEQVISRFLDKRNIQNYQQVLNESIKLNQNLMKLPFKENDADLCLNHNLWDVYRSALKGVDVPLEKGSFCYTIDRTSNKWSSWDVWCKEVIWYGNKKGAYMYNVKK